MKPERCAGRSGFFVFGLRSLALAAHIVALTAWDNSVCYSRCAQGAADLGTGQRDRDARLFGGPEKLRDAVAELQALLYAA